MSGPAYDVVVVGARVAGAGLALRLARAGRRVLLLERSRRGADTVSSHQVQVPGGAVLARWGLLDALVRAGSVGATRARFDLEGVVLAAGFPTVDGVGAVHSPRRTLLDVTLLDAAVAAGADLRERVVVDGVVEEGGRVVGVRGHDAGGRGFVERAPLVVGADGRRSTVARLVGAPVLHEARRPTFATYGYLTGVDLGVTARMYARPGLAVAAFPTDDRTVVVFAARPLSALAEQRA
ncbi:MAG: FAD-dependent monooxygenase, partial [Actinobacteria bacterium]|nr:FAD-dependent monooxygenase [Actinomycetota bacterium]